MEKEKKIKKISKELEQKKARHELWFQIGHFATATFALAVAAAEVVFFAKDMIPPERLILIGSCGILFLTSSRVALDNWDKLFWDNLEEKENQ